MIERGQNEENDNKDMKTKRQKEKDQREGIENLARRKRSLRTQGAQRNENAEARNDTDLDSNKTKQQQVIRTSRALGGARQKGRLSISELACLLEDPFLDLIEQKSTAMRAP